MLLALEQPTMMTNAKRDAPATASAQDLMKAEVEMRTLQGANP
jgi:hypothetical protein